MKSNLRNSSDRPPSKAAFSLWLLLLGVGLFAAFPYFEGVRNANEQPRILQSLSLVDAGMWTVDGPGARGMDAGPDVSWDKEHRLVPNKPPGATPLSVVAYVGLKSYASFLGRSPTLREITWWSRFLGGLLPTLLLCTFAWRRYGRRLGWQVAGGALLIYAFATPVASYARLFYGHQLAAALLFVGSLLVLDGQEEESKKKSFFGALLAGYAVCVEYGAAFTGLPLAVFLGMGLVQGRQSGALGRRLGVFPWSVVGALLPIIALALYHNEVYGSPLQTGYHHAANKVFAHKHSQGFLLGLGVPKWEGFQTHFLSLDGGLFFWSPVVLFAILGLIQGAFDSSFSVFRRESRLSLAILLFYFVIGSSLSFDGGWGIGPRYLVAVFPFLILGWVQVLGQIRTSTAWVFVFFLALAWSMGFNLLAGNLWPHLDLSSIENPIAEVYLPLFFNGFFPYHLFEGIGLGKAGVVLCIVVPFAYACTMLIKNLELRMRTVGAASFGIGVALLGLLFMSPLLPRHARAPKNLAYIKREYEPQPPERKSKASQPILPLRGTR